MAGSFDARIGELAHRVGDGTLTAKVEVDQVYAHFQHEGLDLNHPNGGGAKYLERPWEGAATDFVERLARGTLEPDGLHTEARAIAEDGTRMVFDHAPVEFGDLRASGHPTVEDNGRVVYDRPPAVHRLSESELEAKGDLREMGFGNR